MKILGYIPARLGSERVKMKNLRLLRGEPLVTYSCRELQKVGNVEQFYLNTESDEIANVASVTGIEIYKRSPTLATNSTLTDEIVIDFLQNNKCDAVILVNPTAPFLRAETVEAAVEAFLASGRDALFSTTNIRKHAFYNGAALNFDPAGPSPRTQDLEPVNFINFIICIFKSRFALDTYAEHKSFLYRGSMAYFSIKEEEAWDIDHESEFQVAELFLDLMRK